MFLPTIILQNFNLIIRWLAYQPYNVLNIRIKNTKKIILALNSNNLFEFIQSRLVIKPPLFEAVFFKELIFVLLIWVLNCEVEHADTFDMRKYRNILYKIIHKMLCACLFAHFCKT